MAFFMVQVFSFVGVWSISVSILVIWRYYYLPLFPFFFFFCCFSFRIPLLAKRCINVWTDEFDLIYENTSACPLVYTITIVSDYPVNLQYRLASSASARSRENARNDHTQPTGPFQFPAKTGPQSSNHRSNRPSQR